MSVQRQRGPGWNAGLSIAPQTKTVEILGVLGNLATVRDGFGVTHQIRTDVLRSKSKAPKAGEIWFIDKMLGAWAFQAIVGYDSEADGDKGNHRRKAVYVTHDLQKGETEQGFIKLSMDFKILFIETDFGARTRLYSTAAAREKDVTREVGTEPPPGMDIILDFVTATVLLTSSLSPIPEGANLELVPSALIPISVTSVNGGPITVTLTWVPTE